MAKKKIGLVTGGAGFIGSHLANRLISEGWKIIVVDNLSTGFKSNIPKTAEFVLLDLSEDGFTKKIPALRYDAIFHLAAQSSGEISFDDPLYDVKTNCLSTISLLKWCYSSGIKRFIFTSSMSVYGDQGGMAVKESAVPNPKSFYGIGKLASEKYADIYSKMGMQITSLRLFNVYGPGQNMENMRQGMVSIYMAYIANGKKLLIKGSPDRYRDFVYIDDVINAYTVCLSKPKTYGKVYNVATGKRTYVKELIDLELKAFGYDPGEYPVRFGAPTPGDTMGIFADIKAIKRDTGWIPNIPLSAGLNKMADWCLGLKNIKKGRR